jgi:hypothetical protein
MAPCAVVVIPAKSRFATISKSALVADRIYRV